MRNKPGVILTAVVVACSLATAAHAQKPAEPAGGKSTTELRIGKVGLPLNTQIAPYYNAVTPDFGPDWQLRFQFQFLFPR